MSSIQMSQEQIENLENKIFKNFLISSFIIIFSFIISYLLVFVFPFSYFGGYEESFKRIVFSINSALFTAIIGMLFYIFNGFYKIK